MFWVPENVGHEVIAIQSCSLPVMNHQRLWEQIRMTHVLGFREITDYLDMVVYCSLHVFTSLY